MTLYTAEMKHSADTLKRFTTLQYNAFEMVRKVIMILLAIILIITGVSAGSSAALILCLFLGCIILTNLNAKAESVADQVAKSLNGHYPQLKYSFTENGFTDGEDRPEVPYVSLIRLIEDNDYLYLFISKASGYMIEAKTIQGTGGEHELKKLISEKSGLNWTSPPTILNISLKDIIANLKSRKK